jgi:hypothetical protein
MSIFSVMIFGRPSSLALYSIEHWSIE